jgi:uncharacterized protein YdhG (YjbR/CyaY superfamily)
MRSRHPRARSAGQGALCCSWQRAGAWRRSLCPGAPRGAARHGTHPPMPKPRTIAAGTRETAAAASKRQSIDAYLARLPTAQRTALDKLRQTIRKVVPNAQECISYGLPAFRDHGRVLVWFGGAKLHCSFYPGAHPIAVHARELAGYSTSKGTIRFAAAAPLPAALVRKLVRTRIAEHAGSRAGRRRARGEAGSAAGRRRPARHGAE